MTKINNSDYKFYRGQRMEVTTSFIEGNTEYHQGQILTIEKIVRDCFVAGDGHKVSKIWLTNGTYFMSDFLIEHTKPCRLEVFRSVLIRLKKDENSEIHKLDVLKKEADTMSAFFGSEIIEKSRVDCTREDEISETEKRISQLKMGQYYYAAMDIAIQRWLIHCEETGVKYHIDSAGDELLIELGLFDSKVIKITEEGIHYGEPSISDSNMLISFKLYGAYESQAVAAKYCCDRMARAIQLSFLEYLKESEFCIAEDGNEDK